MKKYQNLIFGLTLFLGMVTFALVGEVLIRLYLNANTIYDIEMTKYASLVKIPSGNARIGHVHRPNAKEKLMNVPVRINSDGLRDYEHAVESPKGHRIIFLGDSLTFGWGVEEEKTFKTLLEKKMNALTPTEIINFGAGNYNTEQEVNLFLEKGPKYKPQEVVLFYFINDAEPTPTRSKWAFLEHSRLISFYWSKINQIMGKFGKANQFENYYSQFYQDSHPGWEGVKKAFSDLKTYCSTYGIDLKVVLLPELHNLKQYPFKREHEKVKGVLANLNIPHLDLIESFDKEIEPQSLWVALDDAHPNAKAHEIISEKSLSFLMEKRSLDANSQAKN